MSRQALDGRMIEHERRRQLPRQGEARPRRVRNWTAMSESSPRSISRRPTSRAARVGHSQYRRPFPAARFDQHLVLHIRQGRGERVEPAARSASAPGRSRRASATGEAVATAVSASRAAQRPGTVETITCCPRISAGESAAGHGIVR